MKAKLILMIFACLVALGSAGAWYLISEREAAKDRRAKFFSNEILPNLGR